ncbi:MAG TPA: beta-ketoacyl synthase N-terminal-like domain-containing protein, partial [Usitatibacter sp.]
MRRVAVTGVGVVSPLGIGMRPFFESLVAGRSGIGRLSMRFEERLVCRIGASVPGFDAASLFPAPRLRMLDSVSQFALAAAAEALGEAGDVFGGLDLDRAGVFVGTGMGGARTTDESYFTLYGEQSDRLKPLSVLLAMNNAAASWIGMEHGLRGAN